jgi:hypothetical protein
VTFGFAVLLLVITAVRSQSQAVANIGLRRSARSQLVVAIPTIRKSFATNFVTKPPLLAKPMAVC